MKLRKILLILICLFISIQFSFGQQVEQNQPTESWLNKYGLNVEPFISYRYDKYSKEDVEKFRAKLDLMNNEKFDEWEGIYMDDFPDLVGISQLRWKSGVGFASFYIYSCLPEFRYLNYGNVTDSPDSILLVPEFAENSPRKSKPITYVKVKWNARYYLVEETSLEAFAEKAAGIYADPENAAIENSQRWRNYMVKGDLEEPLTGLPVFPASYKKFQRLPIEAKIISVGKRTVEEEKSLGDATNIYYGESAWYPVTIDAGKNKGVKKAIWFDVAENDEAVFITQVNEKTSVGFIRREIGENKNDQCSDNDSNKIVCPKIKSGLKVKTKVGDFWNF